MSDYFLERALAVDPREEKLPRWAIDKLHTLRHQATERSAELTALKNGTDKSCFWLESWRATGKFYLPRSTGTLCFDDGAGQLDLSPVGPLEGCKGWLRVSGHGSIIVHPSASNVVHIAEQPR